jgi:NTE family protein
MSRALVLSGGGPVGIGWESGVVAGLAARGVDVAEADLVVGTSAGSVVGAQVALGRDMAEVAERMRGRAGTPSGPVGASAEQMEALMSELMEIFTSTDPADVRRARIGALALAAETMPEDEFLAVFGQLAEAAWPPRYACTAVDAQSGAFVVWDGAAEAPLVRAVASSCAVPGIFPPITIDGRRYVDGGMRSVTNADLARGHDRVLVLSLMDPAAVAGPLAALAAGVEDEVATLRDAGGEVEVVYPDADAAGAIGINLMDPAMTGPAVEAGLRQGSLLADTLAGFWAR